MPSPDPVDRSARRGRARLDALQQELRTLSERVDAQRDRIRKQASRLDTQKERLLAQERRIKELEAGQHAFDVAYDSLKHQLATMETRMQDLESRSEPDPVSTSGERAEARNLLDEVREEHRRIRTRFGVVTRYEERIRRLERALEPTPDP